MTYLLEFHFNATVVPVTVDLAESRVSGSRQPTLIIINLDDTVAKATAVE